jgi:Bacteriophage baseplate protein W
MIGVDRTTGLVISDNDYLRDRIISCLSMREGSHPMRRRKGSRIPEMIDRPTNKATVFEIQVAVIDALSSEQNGFADLIIIRVIVDKISAGNVHLTIVFKNNNEIKTLNGVVVSR